MEPITLFGFIFVGMSFLGFVLAYFYGRKTKEFRFREYIAIIAAPILCIGAYAYYIDARILFLFLGSSMVGFILEYALGLTYHKTLNKRLWTYGRLSVDGYTSFLSIPVWGIAGVVFWLVSKLIGI
ncbi:hypothetical protein L0Y46_04935 [bacterium]|nr:hypothetical protein [bacterium]MCI0680052.1 hypothetical protein [bacterium]